MDELDTLLQQTRSLEPRERSDASDERMIGHALLAGRARHAQRSRVRLIGGVLGSLAMAAAILLAVRFVGMPMAATDRYDLALSTGDRLVARSEVQFEVVSQTPSLRRVRLEHGAMLFDVAPLGAGATFEVVTPSETVTVRGTVFAVEVSVRGTSVRVFEGRVEVRSANGATSLGAGERYGADAATPRMSALEAEGRAAATRRAHAPRVEASAVQETHVEVAVAERAEPTVAEAPRSVSTRGRAVTARETASVSEPVAPVQVPTLVDARARLRAGDAEGALVVAREVPRTSDEETSNLLVVEGDALRALGRHAEAADAYEQACQRSTSTSTRATSGFLAAELRQRRLHDAARARVVLYTCDALDAHAGLRERGLALEAEIAESLHDESVLASSVRSYLEEFPNGPRADWMRARAH